MNSPLSMRTNRYQIGAPCDCLGKNCVRYISDPYASLCRESSSAQFGRAEEILDKARIVNCK